MNNGLYAFLALSTLYIEPITHSQRYWLSYMCSEPQLPMAANLHLRPPPNIHSLWYQARTPRQTGMKWDLNLQPFCPCRVPPELQLLVRYSPCTKWDGKNSNITNHTYKLLWTWEVKQLHHSKVIACDDVKARVWHAGTRDVCFVCVTWPDAHHLVPKDTASSQRQRDERVLLFKGEGLKGSQTATTVTRTSSRWPRWSCRCGSALSPASRTALRTRVVCKHLLIPDRGCRG